MQDVRGQCLEARRTDTGVEEIRRYQEVPVGAAELDPMGTERQVIGLLVEAQLRRRGALETGSKALQNITHLEAPLLLVRHRHVKDVAFVQADDEGGDPTVSRHIVERHDLEADPIGRGKGGHQSLELGGFADDRDDLARGGLKRQCRLRGLPHRLSVQGTPTLLSRRRREDRWRRHGAAVAPGGRHSRRKAAEAQVRQDGAGRIRPIIRGRAVA